MSFTHDVIQAEYERLEHKSGWRLFTCPQKNISSAAVALITINPGGDRFEKPRWSVEDGSAYVVESWKGEAPGNEKLQRQVRRMFRLIGIAPANVLSGYLVPFRSRNWAELPKKAESLQFGKRLWREILAQSTIRTVIAFGKDTGPHVANLFEARLASRHDACWGNETIDLYCFGRNGILIVLPHLSRFCLFGRRASESAFLEVLQIGSSVTVGHNLETSTAPFVEAMDQPDPETRADENGNKWGVGRMLSALSLFGVAVGLFCVAELLNKNDARRK